MNKALFVLFLFSSLVFAQQAANKQVLVNEDIKNMKEVRKLDSTILQDISDPFYYGKASNGVPANIGTTPNTAAINTANKIQAIVGRRVKINDTWFNQNDKINNQTIKSVLKDGVILENDLGEQSIETVKKEYSNEISIK